MQLPIISDSQAPVPKPSDNPEGGQRGRYAVVSLGCPKNLVDTEQMLGRLDEDGLPDDRLGGRCRLCGCQHLWLH